MDEAARELLCKYVAGICGGDEQVERELARNIRDDDDVRIEGECLVVDRRVCTRLVAAAQRARQKT